MPQLLAVAYAAFEDHFVSGADEARGKVLKYLVEQDVLAALPADPNPFGPDPALLASIGRGDTASYYAPVTTPAVPEPDLPAAPTTAAGKQ